MIALVLLLVRYLLEFLGKFLHYIMGVDQWFAGDGAEALEREGIAADEWPMLDRLVCHVIALVRGLLELLRAEITSRYITGMLYQWFVQWPCVSSFTLNSQWGLKLYNVPRTESYWGMFVHTCTMT